MLDTKGQVLYVGKAKSLKARVSSYTQKDRLTVRLKRMVSQTVRMEFVHTNTEAEALLLEANLIKELRPYYNIRLMDDKFFAYIHLTDHSFSRLYKYRGHRQEGGTFYGPFVSVTAITQALESLYKIFKVRSCRDTFFATRKRPCLQYHIKRCTAPCVGYVTANAYAQQVSQVQAFMDGKGEVVRKTLSDLMDQASKDQDYEQALIYRDQLAALTQLSSKQNIHIEGLDEADIFAFVREGDKVCIHCFFFRQGTNLGSYSFFPSFLEEVSDGEHLASFLSLFYTDHPPAKEVLVNIKEGSDGLEEVLSERRGSRVKVLEPQKGERLRVLKDALYNAKHALVRQNLRYGNDSQALDTLQKILNINDAIERIEIYDNSHIQGAHAIGAMVVATRTGLDKKFYRKFTMDNKDLIPGDDYGMMGEVMKRRFAGSLAQDLERNPMPDLLLIDGGIGQVRRVKDTLSDLGLDIPILGVAKGVERNKGDETFVLPDGKTFKLNDDKTILFYIQRLRDEAHRFAITFHRGKRQKALKHSAVDDIPNVGPTRKKALLTTFGSAKALKSATVEEMAKVKGISKALAQQIYDYFHG